MKEADVGADRSFVGNDSGKVCRKRREMIARVRARRSIANVPGREGRSYSIIEWG